MLTGTLHGLLTARVPRVLGWLFVAQILTVFLTGVKLVPGLRNNFGPFEILGGLLIVAFLATRDEDSRLWGHPILRIQTAIAGLAGLSLLWFQAPGLTMGIVQTLILLFQLLFVLVGLNFMVHHQIGPEKLLRLVTYSALVIGPWILFAGLDDGASIQEAGPFRNRAHMANYMLTAFWLVLLYNSWPGIGRRERLVSFAALASTLYPIAVSGRRSVYLSLMIGLVGVGFSFLLASRGRRRSALGATLVLFLFVGVLYSAGPKWVPQLAFFQERVSGIGERLSMAVGDADEAAVENNFFALQRRGVMAAFRDFPLTGIGWGAFYRSPYSPTNHEVHSTPLRFLAELGLLGIGLYGALIAVLLVGSLRLVALLRHTPYRTTAVMLAIALWSLSVSYLYNRHITERTFWLLLLFYVTFEAFARSVILRLRHARQRARAAPGRRPPAQVAAAVGVPPGH